MEKAFLGALIIILMIYSPYHNYILLSSLHWKTIRIYCRSRQRPGFVVNLGTKLWRTPVQVTQFWCPSSGFCTRYRFCKTKQKKMHQYEAKQKFESFPTTFV